MLDISETVCQGREGLGCSQQVSCTLGSKVQFGKTELLQEAVVLLVVSLLLSMVEQC